MSPRVTNSCGRRSLRSPRTIIYYVVPTGQSHQCSIVAGEWEKKPAGALGGAPYASADYAKAALKTFPECKGGEPDEETDTKHRKK